jgi:hypothetical protein
VNRATYRETAEAAWAWVLDQPRPIEPGIHSGWGGLGLALAEVRRSRAWSVTEAALADEVVAAVRADVEQTSDASWFDGLSGHVEVLRALDTDVGPVVDRLRELATPTGWATTAVGPPRFLDDARISDATLGTAAVLRAATAAGSLDLATAAADVLVAEVEHDEHGPAWPFVPLRFRTDPAREMPNFSHGAAGIAVALAEAGTRFARDDWVALATRAAERLVMIGDRTGGGLRIAHLRPGAEDYPEFSYGWCHGPSGTQQVFGALAAAGVRAVAGEAPGAWQDRCWEAVEASGVPERGEPGEWDNDGRCCGTAGVGDLALTAGRLRLATACADALVERALRSDDGTRACWRFVEHRADDPLLPAEPGWMQGAAGIAGFLFRASR